MVKPKVIKSSKSKWKPVSIDPTTFNPADFEGLIGIEELTDYSVGESGSKKLKQKKNKQNTSKRNEKAEEIKKSAKKKKRPKTKGQVVKNLGCIDPTEVSTLEQTKPVEKLDINNEDDDLQSRMAAWNGLGVPSILLKALADKSFFVPTKIQALTLPPAIFGRRDILGAAETGSGKTLAFGLPILSGILEEKKNNIQDFISRKSSDEKETDQIGQSLEENDLSDVDEPLDVDQHSDVDEPLDEDEPSDVDEPSDEDDENNHDEEESSTDENDNIDDNFETECVKVIDNVAFNFPVGGKTKTKSKTKYIQRPLYALVLTPTRELAVQISQHLRDAAKYTDINVAVVVGGLSSQKQERLLNRGPEIVVGTPGRLWELINEGHPHLIQVDSIKYLSIDETDRMLEKGHFEELQRILEKINENENNVKKRQNFVFSATLTLTHEPPRYVMKKKSKRKAIQESARLTPAQKLGSIMNTVGLTDPKVVDITEASGVAQLLTEAQIICTLEEKDYYLYYFLQRHPGRTLIFCNSIEAVRRLTQLFTLLGCLPWPLHAKMHQKQRLKNLERFCGNSRSVLLATDVAARGLDIPNVQHVIHYQTPRTAEGYVHRSGRTARAQQEGLTVLLVEPSEVNRLSRLFKTLGRDSSVPTFPVESQWMPSVKQRVDLARRVDKLELQARRITTEHGWFDKVVKEMDLEISDDELPTSYSRDGGDKVKKQAAAYRKQLSTLLSKPLFPKGFSSKYPTQTGKLVVPLFPGSIAPNKESYQETAVQVLKHSVEEQKALKRKLNSERSKKSKKNKKLKKQAAVSEEASQSSGEGSDAEEIGL